MAGSETEPFQRHLQRKRAGTAEAGADDLEHGNSLPRRTSRWLVSGAAEKDDPDGRSRPERQGDAMFSGRERMGILKAFEYTDDGRSGGVAVLPHHRARGVR